MRHLEDVTWHKTKMVAREPKFSTAGVCPAVATERVGKPDFTFEGLRGRCAPKHRNSRRETAGWDLTDHQEVFVLC